MLQTINEKIEILCTIEESLLSLIEDHQETDLLPIHKTIKERITQARQQRDQRMQLTRTQLEELNRLSHI